MAQRDAFVLPLEDYYRDLDIIKHYRQQMARYLRVQTGKPYDVCLDYVVKETKAGGKFAFTDPRVQYLERQENGDRVVKEGTLMGYLGTAIAKKRLIAPTLTTYLPPSEKMSVLSEFISINVKKRKVAKNEMFKAQREKNAIMYSIKKNEQNNRKLKNNAISGAHVSPTTPLFLKTGHSTLTSNCRSTSAYGNANNEKMLSGNRHYWCADIVKQNIISIISNTNLERFEAMLNQYGLVQPTVSQTMACIIYSTNLYWVDRKAMREIQGLISRLSGVERAAFVYIGDLYHVAKYNDEMMRGFIGQLCAREQEYVEADEFYNTGAFCKVGSAPTTTAQKTRLKECSEGALLLARQVCSIETRGYAVNDLEGSIERYGNLVATTENVDKTIDYYREFIQCLLVTDNMPASIAVFPDSTRRSALTSDTDSTIFTVQDWVNWYCGGIKFDQLADAIAAGMIWLSAQTIRHQLARMSSNFGIGKDKLTLIEMKNEFKFSLFNPMNVAKHYIGLMTAQEGDIFDKPKKEKKGAHLRSASIPDLVAKTQDEITDFVFDEIMAGRKLCARDILVQVADVERAVIEDIRKGGSLFFRRGQIKPFESYVQGQDKSNYRHYVMWQQIFAPKYGEVPLPPYRIIKVGTTTKTATKMNAWLTSMADQALANRIREYMKETNRKHISTWWLPEQIIASIGIPEEIMSAVGVRLLISDVCNSLHLLLESFGFLIKDTKVTKLVSDFY